MSALNIYITDELKERMSKVEANWSEVCRGAIERELLNLENQGLDCRSDLAKTEEWICKSLEPILSDNSVVIKPYPYAKVSPKDKVQVFSAFYTDLMSELKRLRLGTLASASLDDLLVGTHQVEILFPGQNWLSGNLKARLELSFNYPAPPAKNIGSSSTNIH